MADYKNVACYCSILPDKIDTLRRLYKRLENIGLITVIKIDNHVCFTPSQMLRDWGTVYKSDEAEKNPVFAEKNPVEAEKNPLYINNNNNNTMKKDAKASKENPNGFSQDNFSNEEKTVKASIVYGFTPELLDIRKQVIDKVDNYFAKLVFPFDSDEFKRNFYILMCQPKWRTSQKSFSAIQANLNGLSKYPEEFALILIKESISKGWAALEYDSTPEKYEKWEKMKRSVKTEQQSSKEIADMMKYLNNDFD